MGDAISPGMTVGTCAWMEQEWLRGLGTVDKQFFEAVRYMDDILMVYADAAEWDSDRFLADLQASECYWPPLRLEAASGDTFLETRFEVTPNGFKYRLKNTNEGTTKPMVWRYQHFDSYGAYQQKRSTLMASLRKVDKMASDGEQLLRSGSAKLQEFTRLRYPAGIRKFMCEVMYRDTGKIEWRYLRAGQQ